MNKSSAALLIGALCLASTPVLANGAPIPEPGSLALFAAGGIIGAVVSFRKRKK